MLVKKNKKEKSLEKIKKMFAVYQKFRKFVFQSFIINNFDSDKEWHIISQL